MKRTQQRPCDRKYLVEVKRGERVSLVISVGPGCALLRERKEGSNVREERREDVLDGLRREMAEAEQERRVQSLNGLSALREEDEVLEK